MVGHQSWFGPKRGIGEKGPFDGEANRKWEGKRRGRGAARGKINARRQVEREAAAAAAAAAAARASSKYSKLPPQSSKLSRYFFFFFFLSFLFQLNQRAFIFSAFPFLRPIFPPLLPGLDFHSPIICNTKEREWEWGSKPHKGIKLPMLVWSLRCHPSFLILHVGLILCLGCFVFLFIALVLFSSPFLMLVAIVVENNELHN